MLGTDRLTRAHYVVVGLLVMLAPLATSFYVAGLPSLAADLGTSVARAQLTVSATLVGLAVGQLVIGPLSDRYGRRRLMIAGMAGFTVATFLCSIAPNLWVLVGFRLVQGLAGAAGPVIGRAALRDLTTGALTAQALSRLIAIIGIAPILGPIVGALVLGWTSWRGMFVALGVIALISLVVAVVWFPETLPRDRRVGAHRPGARTGAVTRSLLRDRRVVLALAITTLLGIVSFSWSSISPFYFVDWYGLSPQQYSVIVGLNSALFVVGASVNSRLVGRVGPQYALWRGLVAMTAMAALLVVTTILVAPVGWAVLVVVLMMGAYGGMIANAQALALGPYGTVAGTVSALLGMAQFIGGAVVPPIVTASVGPVAALPGLLLAAPALALVLLAVLHRHPVAPAGVEGGGGSTGAEPPPPSTRAG